MGSSGLDVEEFARAAQAFLARTAAAHVVAPAVGEERFALFPDLSPEAEQAEIAAAREWRAVRFDAGFGWITGPPRYGGAGLTHAHERAYVQVERGYALPTQRVFDIGLGMVAPSLLAFGSDRVKDRYLRAMYRGDVIGCQLFSEPGAGSDLSSISCHAVADGGGWTIDGQKVWSSGAHVSSVGLLVCRSGPKENRHRNLTAFALPMEADGVTVRPIRQMTGGSSFNEVFFESVHLSDELRLGEADRGWDVVVATLMNERAAVGGSAAGGRGILSTKRLASLLDRFDRLRAPQVRDELMRLHCSLTVSQLTRQRAEARLRSGERPGPEMSIGKIALTNNLRAFAELLGSALGPRLIADTGEDGTYAWAEFVLGVPGMRLGGGTDEVQKNILAERVLGLPR